MVKKIALEEHFLDPATEPYWRPTMVDVAPAKTAQLYSALTDFGDQRLAMMDKTGIARAVLAIAGPGVQAERDTATAIRNARASNDFLAKEVQKRPDRFSGFAHLAMQDAKAAAEYYRDSIACDGATQAADGSLRLLSGTGSMTVKLKPEGANELVGRDSRIRAAAGTRIILTVDCGIRSPNEAAHAGEIGLDIIISDHHHPAIGELPPACRRNRRKHPLALRAAWDLRRFNRHATRATQLKSMRRRVTRPAGIDLSTIRSTLLEAGLVSV